MDWIILILLIVIGLAIGNGFKDVKGRINMLQADVDDLVGRGQPLSDAEVDDFLNGLDEEDEEKNIEEAGKEKWNIPDFLKKKNHES